MNYKFDYSQEKDLVLRETRNISFDEIIEAIIKGNLIVDLKHPKRKNQRIFVVKVKGYIYSVPYVHDQKRNIEFLKTAYPSRKLTCEYLKGKK
jgi:hypothetical protein